MQEKYIWSELKHTQIGKYAEYYVKMEFTKYGLDVYSSEIDDKGIDFIVKNNSNRYFDIQVKSIRMGKTNYVFIPKKLWKDELRANMLVALVIFEDGKEPQLFLIQAKVWEKPNKLFVNREYGEGKKSKPEWGISITKDNLPNKDDLERQRVVFERINNVVSINKVMTVNKPSTEDSE